MDEHICTQEKALGRLEEAANNLKESVERLDRRINGSFDTIANHIKESPDWRSRIIVVEEALSHIKQEKTNTQKQAQYRVGIIVGVVAGLPGAILAVLNIIKCINGK